jgi:uncharacterized protein (TIGR02300 family)
VANGRRTARVSGVEVTVVKPGLGTKRVCPNCGARYYDLNREGGPVCPKCGTAFDPEALLKTRRTRAPAPVEEEAAEPMAEEEIDADVENEDAEAEGGEDELPIEGGGDEEEEELIEDASELGEDEDDMAEVIENVEDEEER